MKVRVFSYKGKRKDNDNWVSGSALTNEDGGCVILNRNNEGDITSYEVNPETICLATGKTDKNGTEVFTEDFIKVLYSSGQALFGIVKYGSAQEYPFITPNEYNTSPGFHIDWIDCNYDKEKNFNQRFAYWFFNRDIQIEVIGNSFDNPELMKYTLPQYIFD